MAGKHIQKAVDALHSIYSTALAAQLRIVEIDQGLDVGALTDPVEILNHRAPLDNRSPLIQIYETSWQEVDPRNALIAVRCRTVLSHIGTSGGASVLKENEEFGRNYLTAMRQAVFTDVTLGGNATSAVPIGGDSASGAEGDSSRIRLVYVMNWEVRVFA